MLITPQKALQLVLDNTAALPIVSKSLTEAVGHCLGRDLKADRDQPPTDRSAMDGYALRAVDIADCPQSLQLIGEVAAGSDARVKVRANTCVRILTGAPVPPGADVVVKVEETSETNNVVTFNVAQKSGKNIRFKGEEIKRRDVALAKGVRLDPIQIGLCAALGAATIKVYRKPTVAILCTGEELLPVAAGVKPHQLRDSNGPSLCAALQEHGFDQYYHEIIPDDFEVTVERIKSVAVEFDVIIITGGVSVGKYDYVPEAIKKIGGKILYHGVAMKPGKPQLYATLSRNRHIFGLPGNPLSVMTGFHEFTLPALKRLSGVVASKCRPGLFLAVTESIKSKGDRTQYAPMKINYTNNGPTISPIKTCGSGDLPGGVRADGVAIIPCDARKCRKGARLEFHPWRNMP